MEAHAMNLNHASRLAAGATLIATLSGGLALAATSASGSTLRHTSTPTSVERVQPGTPSGCILLNRGDYNACNVGNSGRGELPYAITRHHTPNDCILLNRGDYNACNVGHSGRGDLPYQPVK
jgi:hypothetical protein